MAIDVIQEADEVEEEDDPWSGPPKATCTPRAQSYSDFYHVVTARTRKEQRSERRRSLGGQKSTVKPGGYAEWDFDAHFSALHHHFLDESHAGYQTYYEQLQLSDAHLENIRSSTQSTLDLLSTLSASFKSVETQTDAFRQQCEALLIEQRRLEGLADAIDENARYYTYLEPMTRRLNAPGAANLVKGTDFPDMLSSLDKCLAYMEAHPKHKEAATYRSRYRLLLTRALTLIRHHFTKSLADIAADISKRIQGGQLKETTHSALLYAKFRVPAPELKALGLEIQKRAVLTPNDVDANREPEYTSLLRELYQSYSATRGRLILPLVSRKMAELGSTSQQADVLAFAKASLSFMRGICLDEYELWFEWFETEGALGEFLESLMDPMYDYLRPRTIHETRLERLCELCAMIQGRYMDVDSEEEEDDEEDDGGSAVVSPVANGRKPWSRKLDFAGLVQPALEDAQTRLVFLALNVLRDGIENYKAKPEDLDWPKQRSSPATAAHGVKSKGPALSGKRDPVSATTPTTKTPLAADEETADDGTSIFSKHLNATETTSSSPQQWYPTLPKSLWLLRRIYRLINSTVFDDLAHRIVHSTIASLLSASQQVQRAKKNIPPTTASQDAQLFLITHLLHLKQQIVAFDIEFIPPEVEVDFSSVTNTFYELRERGTSLWNPTSWVRLVSGAVAGGGLLPKVVENMLDAKAELDGRLRTVINEFVNACAGHITAPIDPAVVGKGKDGGKEDVFDPLKAVRTVRGLAEKNVPLLRVKMREFFADDQRTGETLVAAVRDQVLGSYEEFFDAQQSQGTGGSGAAGGGRKVSRKGKGREDEVLGPDLFAEVMEGVFQVGVMVGEDDGGGSGQVSE